MATQLSGTDYANRTKNLLGLVNQLRALGCVHTSSFLPNAYDSI